MTLENRWLWEEVVWGETECQMHRCGRPAELLYDGLPACIDHAEQLLDRETAVYEYPRLRELLPSIEDE